MKPPMMKVLATTTGVLLGIVDVSGPALTLHPTITALVETAVRLAESQLWRHHEQRLDANLQQHEDEEQRHFTLAGSSGVSARSSPSAYWAMRSAPSETK